MKNVVIIGAGQLGSRHLQGLSKIDIPINITVIDISKEALKIAEDRFKEVESNTNVQSVVFSNDNQCIERQKIDLAIIATNSDIRYKIIKELLVHNSVKYFLLEKVVFQNPDNFIEIIQLFKKKQIKAWVNCPRRIYPFYIKLKNEIQSSSKINMVVQGGNWGLGCNSIHYFDLLAYLTNSADLKVNTDFLDNIVLNDYKRKGFIEFTGSIVGKIQNSTIYLFAHPKSGNDIITIKSDSLLAIINEATGETNISRQSNDWKWETTVEKIVYYQSELTNIVASEILSTGNCNLTSLEESYKLHNPFLRGLNDHLEKITKIKYINCPIT